MNFREPIRDIVQPKKKTFIDSVKEFFFWRQAKKRHKRHASRWAIFTEDGCFFPARNDSLHGWLFVGEDMHEWLPRFKGCTECKTRYQALRRIARARKVMMVGFKRV